MRVYLKNVAETGFSVVFLFISSRIDVWTKLSQSAWELASYGIVVYTFRSTPQADLP